MSKCPMCGAPARFAIHLPDGSRIACTSLTDANELLRVHQRAWPNEDLSITIYYSRGPHLIESSAGKNPNEGRPGVGNDD